MNLCPSYHRATVLSSPQSASPCTYTGLSHETESLGYETEVVKICLDVRLFNVHFLFIVHYEPSIKFCIK